MFKPAFFDADGTMLEGFSAFPIFNAFEADGFINKVQNAEVQDVLAQYEGGQIDYPTFVNNTLAVAAAVLKDKSAVTAAEVATDAFADPAYPWFGYVKPTLEDLRSKGFGLILMTAEPRFIAAGLSRALGFDRFLSSEFKTVGQIFTGRVEKEDILGSGQKGNLTSQMTASAEQSIAFGDSEGDLGMLVAVDLAYCIKPTPGLRTEADAKGWKIVDDPYPPVSLVANL